MFLHCSDYPNVLTLLRLSESSFTILLSDFDKLSLGVHSLERFSLLQLVLDFCLVDVNVQHLGLQLDFAKIFLASVDFVLQIEADNLDTSHTGVSHSEFWLHVEDALVQSLDVVYLQDDTLLHLVLFLHLVLETIQKSLHSLTVLVLPIHRYFQLSHHMVSASQETEDASVVLLLLLIGDLQSFLTIQDLVRASRLQLQGGLGVGDVVLHSAEPVVDLLDLEMVVLDRCLLFTPSLGQIEYFLLSIEQFSAGAQALGHDMRGSLILFAHRFLLFLQLILSQWALLGRHLQMGDGQFYNTVDESCSLSFDGIVF